MSPARRSALVSLGLAAGRMDRDIVIQTASVSTDPTTGQDVADWTTARARLVAAEWLPDTASETWRARQIDASIIGVYQIYDLSPRPTPEASRILGHDGRIYDVKGVTEIGRGQGLSINVAARAEEP